MNKQGINTKPNTRASLTERYAAGILKMVVAALIGGVTTLCGVYAHSVLSEPSARTEAVTEYADDDTISCDFTITREMSEADGEADFAAVEPGNTVCIEAGSRSKLTLKNFRGIQGNSIKFINQGGQVIIESSQKDYAGLFIRNSEYIRITGTGVSAQCGSPYPEARQKCGIMISGADRGIAVSEMTGNIEIDHIEVHKTHNAGIAVKNREISSASRDEWTQHNTHLHHNYIRNTGTEGFYVGSSFYKDGKDPLLEGVEVNHNLILRTGWDGLQVGSAVNDCTIHHNVIIESGLKNKSSQSTGIMNNHGSVCDIYNNLVVKSTSAGIYIQGNGGNRIFNNVILQPGQAGKAKADGIVVSIGSNQGQNVYIWNNTIIQPSRYGIKFRNNQGDNNLIQNNLIVNPGVAGHDETKGYISTILDNVTIEDNIFVEEMAD